jgi:hypothetical protein
MSLSASAPSMTVATAMPPTRIVSGCEVPITCPRKATLGESAWAPEGLTMRVIRPSACRRFAPAIAVRADRLRRRRTSSGFRQLATSADDLAPS